MNFKATVATLAAIFTIVAFGVVFFVFNNGKSDVETFNKQIENTTIIERMEAIEGFDKSTIIDVPIAPLACAKGMRYDQVSNKCKRVI
jgi:ABC-type transporter Mla maintaining outer membrane lipid asymmetry permease subunit MlaE